MTADGRISYSIDEVAAVLGISRRTVYREITCGRLASYKCRSRRLISRRALDAWLSDRERAERAA